MSRGKKRGLTLESLEYLIRELNSIYETLPPAYYKDEDENDEEGESTSFKKGLIESEDVEVAISALVESMNDRCNLATKSKSLTELFEAIFSSTDDLVDLAVNLEDAVNGYFGELFGDCLDLANSYLDDILRILRDRGKRWGRSKVSKKS